MKPTLVFIFAFCVFNAPSYSQTMEGTYTNTWESNAGSALTYTLTLNPDKTFKFESYRIFESSQSSKTTTVLGNWNQQDRLLSLTTKPTSNDNDLVEKLNNNSARYKAYSPRHRLYDTVKPSLKFYESDVFYAKGMKLFKVDADTIATSM